MHTHMYQLFIKSSFQYCRNVDLKDRLLLVFFLSNREVIKEDEFNYGETPQQRQLLARNLLAVLEAQSIIIVARNTVVESHGAEKVDESCILIHKPRKSLGLAWVLKSQRRLSDIFPSTRSQLQLGQLSYLILIILSNNSTS